MVGDYLKTRLALTAVVTAALAAAVPMARATSDIVMGDAEPAHSVTAPAHSKRDGSGGRPVLAIHATPRSW